MVDTVRLIQTAFAGIGKPGKSHRLVPGRPFRDHVLEATGLPHAGKKVSIDRKLKRKSLQSGPARQASAGSDRVIKECHASPGPS
jgi:hypothetical protein